MLRNQTLHFRWTARHVLAFLLLLTGVGCGQTAVSEATPQTPESESQVVENTPLAAATAVPTNRPAPAAPTAKPPLDTALPPAPPTAVPTRTTAPLPTALPTATLPSVPEEIYINGLPPPYFISMPEGTIERSREIFELGQRLGRNAHSFSKIGDSIIDTPEFFTWFDSGDYDLGEYAYLAGAIDYFAGSYGRFGVALRDGLNSTAVLDPTWADKDVCQPNETPLACEIRLNNPAIIFIHFGTNDWSGTYDANMRQILDYAIDQGVVPIIITKANQVEGGNGRNQIVRFLAEEYQIPVWDFDLIAETLPNRGLDQDNAHMTIAKRPNYSNPGIFGTGYGPFNLSGLMMLDTFLRKVIYG